ncbi:MAG: phosphatidate cytidylyltransferase [Deltaproteobacteria bacterium]|nr:phosphatidate cytidylyltransferase [Deltaproteobacteria bacterium]
MGQKKLCPSISPNKTVEGAIGGVIGGVSIAILVSIIFRVPAGFFTLIVLAGSLSILGMLGDLFESIIKRGTGFKDSGTLLRGHGGILDRVDSLFFTAPFLYYILIYSGFK